MKCRFKVGDIVVMRFNEVAYKDRISHQGIITCIKIARIWRMENKDILTKRGKPRITPHQVYETEDTGLMMWGEDDFKRANKKERLIFRDSRIEKRI